MRGTNLTDLVDSLSTGEKEAVRAFIEYLRDKKEEAAPLPFLGAVDEFIAEHPELLRNLAK